MIINKKQEKYLKNHPGSTIENWQNQRHKMHIRQAAMTTFSRHTGSKSKKVLMYHINSIDKKVQAFGQYVSRYGRK